MNKLFSAAAFMNIYIYIYIFQGDRRPKANRSLKPFKPPRWFGIKTMPCDITYVPSVLE